MKKTILKHVGDLFCPNFCLICGRCGDIICACCEKYIYIGENNYCLECGEKLDDQRRCCRCVFLGKQYYIGERKKYLKDLVNLYKFNQVRSLADIFARIIVTNFNISDSVLVPLPTINKRVRERGFDHIDLIVKRLSQSGCGTARLLKRNRNTVQVGKDKDTRMAQATCAYGYNTKNNLNSDSKVILVDDI